MSRRMRPWVQSGSEDLWLYLLIGGGVLVLVPLVLALLVWRPFNIPSVAMAPTLQIGDYVFARHYWSTEPQRGDVAVFLGPRSTYYVKRLIGLPGDKVQLREGTLYINGVAARREAAGNYSEPVNARTLEVYTEMLPSGMAHSILLDERRVPPTAKPCDRPNEDSGDIENTCPFVVPPNRYFAIGDNRDDSWDSRSPGFGFVARDNLVGRMELIVWAAKPSRIGTLVH